jgi:flagellum-specific ATP synthase
MALTPPHFTVPPLAARADRTPVGWHWRGRMSDAQGNTQPALLRRIPAVSPRPPGRFQSVPIEVPLATGVDVIDGLLTIGRGQRVALLAGGGVGKSVLLSMIARGCAADDLVVALIGERAREIAGFWHDLGRKKRENTHLVAAPAANDAVSRLESAQRALVFAEWLRSQGRHVLLLIDSLSRVADAFVELNPGRPVSGFLQRMIERAGADAGGGSITAVFTVLDEAGAAEVPIANAVRAAVDGHIYLSRALAERGCFPAVDVLRSASRPMPDIVTPEHLAASVRVRAALALAADSAEIRLAGLYEPGANPGLDTAVAVEAEVRAWQRQAPDRVGDAAVAAAHILDVAQRYPA